MMPPTWQILPCPQGASSTGAPPVQLCFTILASEMGDTLVKSYTVGQIMQFAGWAGIAWKVIIGGGESAWLAVSGDSSISGYSVLVLMEGFLYAIPFAILLLAGKWVRRRELARSRRSA